MGAENYIEVIYDGGTVQSFDSMEEADQFMDLMENVYGYNFEYKGRWNAKVDGKKIEVVTYKDKRKNVCMAF